MEAGAQRLQTLYADGMYAGGLVELVAYLSEWSLEIVKRSDDQKGFVVLPKRWIVERTIAWLNKYRRLVKDYEYLLEVSEAWITWAMVDHMLGRLTRTAPKMIF